MTPSPGSPDSGRALHPANTMEESLLNSQASAPAVRSFSTSRRVAPVSAARRRPPPPLAVQAASRKRAQRNTDLSPPLSSLTPLPPETPSPSLSNGIEAAATAAAYPTTTPSSSSSNRATDITLGVVIPVFAILLLVGAYFISRWGKHRSRPPSTVGNASPTAPDDVEGGTEKGPRPRRGTLAAIARPFKSSIARIKPSTQVIEKQHTSLTAFRGSRPEMTQQQLSTARPPLSSRIPSFPAPPASALVSQHQPAEPSSQTVRQQPSETSSPSPIPSDTQSAPGDYRASQNSDVRISRSLQFLARRAHILRDADAPDYFSNEHYPPDLRRVTGQRRVASGIRTVPDEQDSNGARPTSAFPPGSLRRSQHPVIVFEGNSTGTGQSSGSWQTVEQLSSRRVSSNGKKLSGAHPGHDVLPLDLPDPRLSIPALRSPPHTAPVARTAGPLSKEGPSMRLTEQEAFNIKRKPIASAPVPTEGMAARPAESQPVETVPEASEEVYDLRPKLGSRIQSETPTEDVLYMTGYGGDRVAGTPPPPMPATARVATVTSPHLLDIPTRSPPNPTWSPPDPDTLRTTSQPLPARGRRRASEGPPSDRNDHSSRSSRSHSSPPNPELAVAMMGIPIELDVAPTEAERQPYGGTFYNTETTDTENGEVASPSATGGHRRHDWEYTRYRERQRTEGLLTQGSQGPHNVRGGQEGFVEEGGERRLRPQHQRLSRIQSEGLRVSFVPGTESPQPRESWLRQRALQLQERRDKPLPPLPADSQSSSSPSTQSRTSSHRRTTPSRRASAPRRTSLRRSTGAIPAAVPRPRTTRPDLRINTRSSVIGARGRPLAIPGITEATAPAASQAAVQLASRYAIQPDTTGTGQVAASSAARREPQSTRRQSALRSREPPLATDAAMREMRESMGRHPAERTPPTSTKTTSTRTARRSASRLADDGPQPVIATPTTAVAASRRGGSQRARRSAQSPVAAAQTSPAPVTATRASATSADLLARSAALQPSRPVARPSQPSGRTDISSFIGAYTDEARAASPVPPLPTVATPRIPPRNAARPRHRRGSSAPGSSTRAAANLHLSTHPSSAGGPQRPQTAAPITQTPRSAQPLLHFPLESTPESSPVAGYSPLTQARRRRATIGSTRASATLEPRAPGEEMFRRGLDSAAAQEREARAREVRARERESRERLKGRWRARWREGAWVGGVAPGTG